ncbi:capsular polysaccharide transport system permease protein [Roseovarius halotolerans]|uniref:Polysialic acid transport protein KpsM n=1 Tax=Roseovarius halotolerans TaxID=505353 RepID=A0A1X6Z402_9RHOB|nr:ABC transporter permease [Roseovarius halotolerans]RKT32225.1 capsular polysaccharide transport system permease protein [Roseovarius halotolerans]SLN40075.1 Polysialic acid transport protein KpsM [Roseovarius halotolerans]
MTPTTVTADQRPATGFRMARVVLALILREMSSTYGRSPGGYAWAVLQPIGTIVILAIAFSLLLRAPSLGTSFLLFYASGLLPLRLFQEMAGNVGAAISFNRALLEYPRVTFIDVIVARALLVLLTQAMVATLILSGIFAWGDIRESVDLAPIVTGFSAAAFLGVGFGVFNCFAMFSFPLWKTLWTMLTRPLILISGVFYLFEDLPPNIQDLLWFNPLLHVAGITRQGFYSIYEPGYISPVLILGTALVPMLFGFLLLFRFGRSMLHN